MLNHVLFFTILNFYGNNMEVTWECEEILVVQWHSKNLL